MKICLIRPPIVVPRLNQTAMFTPPLGVAYVAAMLRSEEFAVTVIDGVGEGIDSQHTSDNDCVLYGLTIEQIVQRIPLETSIIGVSVGFSFEWPLGRALSQAIRKAFPEALMVAGGEHASALPVDTLRAGAFDVVVRGEGEATMLAIARSFLEGNWGSEEIPGTVRKTKDHKIIVGPLSQRIRKLNEIPWPAWDLIPIQAYLDRQLGFGVSRGRSMPILASRGCPYQCTFCSSPTMWTTRWLARAPSSVLDEISYYMREYGATNFDFYDLTAIVKKDWVVEFCQKVEQSGMVFTWQLPSGTRSEAIDDEVAKLLYASGCRNLSYAPENGSPAVLERIKKKIKPEKMLVSMRSSVAAGLNVKCNLMLGFPGETFGDVIQTFMYIWKMAMAGAHDLSIWAFSPYPGSQLFTALREDGAITIDDAYYDGLRAYADLSIAKSYSDKINGKQLKILRYAGTIIFYIVSWLRRPWRPFRIIYNVLSGREESRGDMALRNIWRRIRSRTRTSKCTLVPAKHVTSE